MSLKFNQPDAEGGRWLTSPDGQAIAYLPTGKLPTTCWPTLPPLPYLGLWLPTVSLPVATAQAQTVPAAWLASAQLESAIAAGYKDRQSPQPSVWAIADDLETQSISFRWYALGAARAELEPAIAAQPSALTRQSRILALVPHYRCEPWLRRCLQSLVAQTRPLDAIAVLDDASPRPPRALVAEFPQVTLLAAPENVGPYRLIQQAIADTNYDAYLFQDADDWSSCDRLALLLAAAERTGAELIGTQMVRLGRDRAATTLNLFPADGNRAVASQPGHPLAHPTSLVSRALVQRLGGFASGLRFGGDTEFVLRAVWQARVLNIPQFAYFRRDRPGSLTTAAATGLGSPARESLTAELKRRARDRQRLAQQGQRPDLQPLAIAPPFPWRHLSGPPLSGWS